MSSIKENWIFSAYFRKTFEYKISPKFVQWNSQSFQADGKKKTFFFPVALRPVVGPWPSLTEVSRSHSGTPHSAGLLWTSDQPVTQTSTWQHTTLTTTIHAPGGIWTHNFSRRAAADQRLSPRCHWDRPLHHWLAIFTAPENKSRQSKEQVTLYDWNPIAHSAFELWHTPLAYRQ